MEDIIPSILDYAQLLYLLVLALVLVLVLCLSMSSALFSTFAHENRPDDTSKGIVSHYFFSSCSSSCCLLHDFHLFSGCPLSPRELFEELGMEVLCNEVGCRRSRCRCVTGPGLASPESEVLNIILKGY